MTPPISSKCIPTTSHGSGAYKNRFSIPEDLSKAFGPFFRGRNTVEEENVEAIISAIDSNDENLCKRLDAKCLSILCGIVRLSAECPSQLRGYCVLAVCTCRSRDVPTLTLARNFSTQDIPQVKTQKRRRKSWESRTLSLPSTNFLITAGPIRPVELYVSVVYVQDLSDQSLQFGFFVSTLLTGNPPNGRVMVNECSDEDWYTFIQ